MPWKVCNPMDERLKFIARLLDGDQMALLCREFGISRKTGYKILTRYNEIGLDGLTDRSRRPYRHANQLPTPDRDADRAVQAGQAALGRSEDQGETGPALSGCAHARHQHGACGARSSWSGQAPNQTTQQGRGHHTLSSAPTQ
jgi:Helix-turn-helix domain